VRQAFGLGGEEPIADGPNQIAGKQDVSRITVTAGRFSVIDIFNGNSYLHARISSAGICIAAARTT
jgi:high affinity Mn2+ porin